MSDFNADLPDFAPGQIKSFRKRSADAPATDPEWDKIDSDPDPGTDTDTDTDFKDGLEAEYDMIRKLFHFGPESNPESNPDSDSDTNADPDHEPSDDSAPARFYCRHIFTDGRRCRAASLKGEHFCYYHHTSRKPVADPRGRQRRRTAFTLPVIEDRSSIQAAINGILQRIASNEIDPRRAGLALYGIQTAAVNLPRQPLLAAGEKAPQSTLSKRSSPTPPSATSHPSRRYTTPTRAAAPVSPHNFARPWKPSRPATSSSTAYANSPPR